MRYLGTELISVRMVEWDQTPDERPKNDIAEWTVELSLSQDPHRPNAAAEETPVLSRWVCQSDPKAKLIWPAHRTYAGVFFVDQIVRENGKQSPQQGVDRKHSVQNTSGDESGREPCTWWLTRNYPKAYGRAGRECRHLPGEVSVRRIE
jgi:hypothetical protein